MIDDVMYLSNHPCFFDKLTCIDHLLMCSVLSKKQKNLESILQHFDLHDYKDTLTTHLSSGQKKCLALACITIKHPKLILLDEPSNDLDKEHRQLLHRTLYDLSQKGSTCIFSTHQLEDLAKYQKLIKIESKILSWHQLKPQDNKGQHNDIRYTAQA